MALNGIRGKEEADRHFPVTASCILSKCGGDPERSQFDKCVYGWATVFMEFGHVVTTSRDIGAAA
jgi:hypothetical protein